MTDRDEGAPMGNTMDLMMGQFDIAEEDRLVLIAMVTEFVIRSMTTQGQWIENQRKVGRPYKLALMAYEIGAAITHAAFLEAFDLEPFETAEAMGRAGERMVRVAQLLKEGMKP